MKLILSRLIGAAKRIVTNTWQLFTGVVLTLLAFGSYFTDYKQPDISVEITEVTTTSADPIDIQRIPDLSKLKEFLGVAEYGQFKTTPGKSPGLLADEIDRLLQIESDRASAYEADIEKINKQLSSVLLGSSGDQDVLLTEIRDELMPPSYGRASTPDNNLPKAQRIAEMTAEIRKELGDREKWNKANSAMAIEAAKQWSLYKEKVLPNKARLVVTVAIGNQGSGATSLKPQGLLRADLGDGNYLDLPMRLSGYQSSSELGVLPTKSFKVMRFQSDEVQSMNPSDRQRYTTFLGNIAPATIYVTDVRNNKYASNSVPFSPGVYEQKVYDTLKQFASRNITEI